MRHVTTTRSFPTRTTRSACTLALAFALLVSVQAASCGGSSSGSSGDVATPFVGVWTFDTGSAAAMCTAGLPNATIPLAGLSGDITKVDNTHIRFSANNGSCVVNFAVSGSTATAASGQSCTLTVPSVGPQPIGVTTWTLTLSGTTMSATIMGTAFGTPPNNLCTASGSGTLTMHPPTDGGSSDATTGG